MSQPVTSSEPHLGQRESSRTKTIIGRVVIGGGGMIVVLALLLQLVGARNFWIPSESMDPTIPKNSRIITWKLGDIERGDVIVYSKPDGLPGSTDDLMHRAIGLGGETISFRDGQVFIDGLLLVEPYLPRATETVVSLGRPAEIVVPDGHVFVMGDNRTRSADSRLYGTIDVSTVSANHVFRWWGGD